MGMYVFEIVPVQNLAPTFDYDLSVTASSDGSITSNEVFQFTLNDTLTNVTLDAPEHTKVNYENHIVTWEVGTLDAASKDDTPLVLNINAEHPTELQEGTLIASAVTDTFFNEQGKEMIENYDDFNFGPPAPSTPSFELQITPQSSSTPCQYTLDFKAVNNSNTTLNTVSFEYTLAEGFTWVSPNDDASSFAPTKWTIGNLNPGPSGAASKTATIQYTGTVQEEKQIFSSINGTAKYNDKGPKDAKYTGIHANGCKHPVRPCPPPPPDCCEDCPVHETANFDACQQTRAVTIYPELSSDGREIKVKVKLDFVCKNKKVVVGLELFEGEFGKPGAVRRALKVIELTRTTGGDNCASVECDCATFFIPGSICPSDKFFIKAQAHYYEIGSSGCDCASCSNPPPHGILE